MVGRFFPESETVQPKMVKRSIARLVACVSMASAYAQPSGAAAEEIKIGLLKSAGSTAVYLAQEKGYFTAEGLDAQLMFFDAAEPIAVAAVAGAVDIGSVGTSAGMFSLGAQGALKLIGGQSRESPGFQTLSFLVSNHAYEAGFKSFQSLGGHSVAVAQIGSGSHYSVTLIAAKYGIDLATIRILPLQSIPNQLSAVTGGQADAAVVAATPVLPAIERGDVRLLGWVGDQVPWQIGAIFAATKTVNDRHDLIERFLRAFRKGAREYHDAFTGPGERRQDSAAAPEILAVMAKYTGQPAERLRHAIAYIDPEGRIDLADMQRQIDWFRSQNLLKGAPRIEDMIDQRTVIALPAPAN
jgi:NitT/TauT family transport system substrate-binding protein